MRDMVAVAVLLVLSFRRSPLLESVEMFVLESTVAALSRCGVKLVSNNFDVK